MSKGDARRPEATPGAYAAGYERVFAFCSACRERATPCANCADHEPPRAYEDHSGDVFRARLVDLWSPELRAALREDAEAAARGGDLAPLDPVDPEC